MICFIIYNLCIQTFPSSYFSQLGLQVATTVHYFIFLFRLAARCVDQFGMEALMDLPTPLGKTCLSTFGLDQNDLLYLYLYHYISIYIYIIYLYIYKNLCIYVSMYLSIYQTIYQSIYLSSYLSIYVLSSLRNCPEHGLIYLSILLDFVLYIHDHPRMWLQAHLITFFE